MKRWGKTLLGLLLCAALAAGLLPGAVSTAKADGKTITGLGTGTIGSPTGNGEWDYVYYGKYNNNPVKYRVLSAETTDFGGTTMLLDCDNTLFEAAFDTNNSNIWENSSLKSGLNGDLFLSKEGVFTPAERDAIASSIKAEKNNDHDGSGWDKLNYTPLTGQKIFLLDASEATSSTYGYTDWGIEHNFDWRADSRAKSGADIWWWLRSPYSAEADKASMVRGAGNIADQKSSNSDVGVSPALNINLASVIFSSEISSADKTYKLTIRDNDIGITPGTVTRNASAVTVPYTISGSNQGNVTQVSVVMTNATWSNDAGWTAPSGEIPEKYYYGRLDVNKGFTLPTDYDPDWNAYVVAEGVSAEEATDYASAPVEITIPHAHDFTYTASDAAVTAKCAAGCPDGYDTNGFTLTLKATSDLKYDGNAKTVTIDGAYPDPAPDNLEAKPTTVSYYKSTGEGSTTVDGEALSGAPSDCGDYVAQMTWGGATASLSFSITGDAISFTVTFKVVNGEWNNGGSDEITVTLNGHEGDTLKLAEGDVPAAGAKPKENYKAGSWSPAEPKTGDVISADTTYTYTYAAEDISYSVTDVQGAEYTIGVGKDAVFTVKRSEHDEKTYPSYTGSTMDGVALPEGSHTTAQGSLILTLKSAYLDTLSAGDHKLKINFTDGSVETTVKIIAAAPTPTPTPSPTSKPVPKTGDSADFPLWLGLILLGLAGLALVAGTGKAARKK